MSLQNVVFDTIITMVDKDTGEKFGQLRYIVKDSEAEVFDTYMFPEYRRKKMMSDLLSKVIPELKVSGVSKISLKYFDDGARMAWEKMGFVQIGKSCLMELNL
jgi:GNAT superfamily N-acetyltransferase